MRATLSLCLEVAAAEGTARCPRPQRGIGRRVTSAELIERVIALGHERLADAVEHFHADAVWVRDAEEPPLRGRHEIALETQQIAWVYEVTGSRVSRVTVYRTWEQAREAAGVAPRTPPTRRLRDWRLAIGAFRSAWQARSRARAVLT